MKNYCEKCGREVETKIIVKNEEYTVCGEPIMVEARVLTCAECGEELFSEELDNETLLSAYNEYRKRHRLLSAEEIKEIREQYQLSQRGFAKLLNWGDKTIYRYENGSIQDKAHNSLMLFLREPENMRIYLNENEVLLAERQKARLLAVVDKLINNEKRHTEQRLLETFFDTTPSEDTGYKAFDYDKACAMVLFFANKNTNLLKTKLMKLLNYSDMIFYKENGVSISGMKYAHLPYGPVPVNFDILLGTMEADHIARIEVIYDNGYERHQVIPESDMPANALSNSELAVLDRIYKKFENYGSAEISNYSHKEKGYIGTKIGEVISYSYAKDIELD